MTLKPLSSSIRLAFNLYIYSHIFNQNAITYNLCGPLTIKPERSLFYIIVIIELIRCYYPLFIWAVYAVRLGKFLPDKIGQLLVLKYQFVLALKLVIILNGVHRWKYYTHTAFLEIFMVLTNLLIDLFGTEQIVEVSEILVLDAFNIITTVYELTRTFCPNYAIYWFVCNLFVLCFSQVEGQRQKTRGCLFVKHDVYRILVLSMGYFAIFAVVQIPQYGWRMMCFFLAGFYHLYRTIQQFDQNNLKKALFNIVYLSIVLILTQLTFDYWLG